MGNDASGTKLPAGELELAEIAFVDVARGTIRSLAMTGAAHATISAPDLIKLTNGFIVIV
jgi:hypothetical protein